MNFIWSGFAAKLHSWSIVAQNISRQFKKDYNVDIFSTNGTEFFPEDLKQNLKCSIEEKQRLTESEYIKLTSTLKNKYDVQMSYTAMMNFPRYFTRGDSNRFGIWCYEFAGKNALPNGFAKNHVFVDKILAPSTQAKEVFVDSGVPENKIKVIPHGYDDSYLNRSNKLFESNKFVFGSNIAQPHLRKNIKGLLEGWGKAFNKKDDVVLYLKVSSKKGNLPFEVDFYSILNEFKKTYKDHAEIIVIDKFIDNISDFYRSCDAIYSLSNAESFLMPALEALVSNKVLICSNYGGQLDFCNNDNSLLVDGKIIRANPKMLYWENKTNTFVFEPNTDDAAEKLKYAFNNKDKIISKINRQEIIDNYSWSSVYDRIKELI